MGIYSLYATVPWYHGGYHSVYSMVLPLLLVLYGPRVLYVYPRVWTITLPPGLTPYRIQCNSPWFRV